MKVEYAVQFGSGLTLFLVRRGLVAFTHAQQTSAVALWDGMGWDEIG
jgi:hypothetical protein